MRSLQIYIGWDQREEEAYRVAEYSILSRASVPVDIKPLKLSELGHILTRPIERLAGGKLWCPISRASMSTEFAISRFCVPFLQDSGWALFADCDVLAQADIRELFDLAEDKYAVMVVKHDQVSGPSVKMDGQSQVYYLRKNWSSVVLWNCSHSANKRLTLEALNTLPGRELHGFCWLKDEEIGSLPREWNVLVEPAKPKLLHYTLGGPWFLGYKDCDRSEEWLDEQRKASEWPAAHRR